MEPEGITMPRIITILAALFTLVNSAQVSGAIAPDVIDASDQVVAKVGERDREPFVVLEGGESTAYSLNFGLPCANAVGVLFTYTLGVGSSEVDVTRRGVSTFDVDGHTLNYVCPIQPSCGASKTYLTIWKRRAIAHAEQKHHEPAFLDEDWPLVAKSICKGAEVEINKYSTKGWGGDDMDRLRQDMSDDAVEFSGRKVESADGKRVYFPLGNCRRVCGRYSKTVAHGHKVKKKKSSPPLRAATPPPSSTLPPPPPPAVTLPTASDDTYFLSLRAWEWKTLPAEIQTQIRNVNKSESDASSSAVSRHIGSILVQSRAQGHAGHVDRRVNAKVFYPGAAEEVSMGPGDSSTYPKRVNWFKRIPRNHAAQPHSVFGAVLPTSQGGCTLVYPRQGKFDTLPGELSSSAKRKKSDGAWAAPGMALNAVYDCNK
jgi:hypothetical protein